MSLSYFRERWPHGITLMSQALFIVLRDLDTAEAPLEGIDGKAEQQQFFAALEEGMRELVRDARGAANGKVLKDTAAKQGIEMTSEMAKDAKLHRKHLKLIETQALQFLRQLAKRIEDPKTRSRTLLFLREWRADAQQRGLSRKQMADTLLDYLRHDYFDAPSDSLTRQMLEKIERADFEIEAGSWPVARGIANRAEDVEHWAFELMPVEHGKQREGAFLPAEDINEKTQRAMADYARSLGDNDSDLMIFAMARFAERAKNPDDKVTITIDELMQALGYKKQRGGGAGEAYQARDKVVVRERLEALQDGYLTIRRAGRDPKSRRQIDLQSLVLIIEDRAGQADLDGRIKEWTAVTVRFGRAWSSRLFEQRGRMTALLQAQALGYDAIKERIEKRLLKRLGWFWKLNDKTTATRTVFEWISADIGDDPAGYVRRDAERFEDALNRLRHDGQIAGWRYTDGLPDIKAIEDGLPRGWLDQWQQREIAVEAPLHLQVAYQARRAKPVQIEAKPVQAVERINDNIGQQFRALRSALGISALKAATELEIDNSVLSRIESGKRAPTQEQRGRLEAWMRDRRNT